MNFDPSSSTAGPSRRGALELLGGLIALAMIPENPVVGGTVLRRAAIASPNFATGLSGWSVNQDGTAEFNNVTIRNGQVISGAALYYNGSPALGNLVASVAANGATDPFGNAYLMGVTSYQPVGAPKFASQLLNGAVFFYSAASVAGPWSILGTVSADATNNIRLGPSPGGTVITNQGETVTGGITADTETITSAQSGGQLLQVINTASSGTPQIRVTTAALGNPWFGGLVSGDTNARALLESTGGGLTRLRLGPGNATAETSLTRLAANSLMAPFITFDNAGAGETWNAVTFANSWANGASGANLRYKRVAAPDKCVMLVGRIVAPAGIVNGQNVITALPAAYQPANQQDIAAWDNTAVKPLRFQMGANGVLTYQAGGAVAGDSIDIYPCLYSLDA